MKKIYAVLLSPFVLSVQAQDCSSGRYSTYSLFPALDSTLAVTYGSNTPTSGTGSQLLRMDIWEPAGDTMSARPVIIVAFGGSFVAGSRHDVAGFCRDLARMGYVAIAPDYRIGFFFPTEITTTKAVVRCMHDLKGCVRYLRKTVAEDGNPYRIDPDRIIVGGVSAGAIGAMHAAYMDHSYEIPPILYGDTALLGGVEGNSGSPGYSSDMLACFSFSGALGDTIWIQPGDQPLVSVHEVGDEVVPYGTQEVSVFGIPTGLTAAGSSDVHRRLDHVGVPNCFLSYPGNGHVGYLNYDPVNSIDHMVQFCAKVVCGQPAGCEATLFASVTENDGSDPIMVFPNPVYDELNVIRTEAGEVEVVSMAGQVVLRATGGIGRTTLDVSGLSEGCYVLRQTGSQPRTARFIKLAP